MRQRRGRRRHPESERTPGDIRATVGSTESGAWAGGAGRASLGPIGTAYSDGWGDSRMGSVMFRRANSLPSFSRRKAFLEWRVTPSGR